MDHLTTRTSLLHQVTHGQSARVLAGVVLSLFVTAASLAMPLVVSELITAVATEGRLSFWLSVLALLAVVSSVGAAVYAIIVAQVAEGLVRRIRDALVWHTLRQPVRDVSKAGTGDLTSRVTADTVQFRGALDIGIGQLPQAVLLVLGTVAAMAYLDPVLLGVSALAFMLAAVLITWLYRGLQATALEHQTHIGQLAQGLAGALEALPTIKSLRAEAYTRDQLAVSTQRAADSGVAYAWRQAFLSPVTALAQQFALVGVIIVGAVRIDAGALSFAEMAAFLLYLLQVVTPVSVVAMGLGRLKAGMAIRQRFDEVLEARLETRSGEDAVACPDIPEDGSVSAVEFDLVSFDYDGQPVLEDATFAALGVGLTALVGPSGAGKSTALKLVERFERVSAGEVRVAGIPLESWNLHALRGTLAYVDQDSTLLDDTVRTNLMLGAGREVSDDELMYQLEKVGLADVVASLPHGLDTRIGAGVELSGGQRQRLAITRALLGNASVILLDEPTSQLDSLSEERFRRVVGELAKSRSVVVVAHRLSTVRNADRIVALDRGRVVGTGTHNELLDNCELYRELVAGQFMADAPQGDTTEADARENVA